MEKVMNEDCKIKDYMKRKSIQDVRDILAERLSMLPLAANFGKDKRFMKYEWKCIGCVSDVPEDQAHIATSCPGYSDLREKYNLSTDGLLRFYREVLSRRDEKEKE